MMHPLCLSRMKEYIKDESDKVQNVILNLCMLPSDKIRLENLTSPYEDFHDDSPTDSRIKFLEFSNFRTYPANEGYCVDFVDRYKKRISSLLLVGQNGSGKSTLYTALEKIYTGKSSYAAKMSQSEGDYLTFGFGTGPHPKDKRWALDYALAAESKHSVLSSGDKFIHPLSVPTFFCSDDDVQKMKDNKILFEWILEQMGYAKLKDAIKWLDDEKKKLNKRIALPQHSSNLSYTEYQDILLALMDYNPNDDKCKEEIFNAKENISTLLEMPCFFKEKWEELRSLQEKSSHDPIPEESAIIGVPEPEEVSNSTLLETKKENLVKLYAKFFSCTVGVESTTQKLQVVSDLLEEQKIISDYENISERQCNDAISLLNTSEKILSKFRIELVKEFIQEYNESITKILEKFSNHGESYNFTPIDDIENVKLEIHVELKGNYNTLPHEYFNEFRFKLFCVTMKIAIAYYWMVHTNKALPIVIDDIFNANDFENSVKLEHFAYFLKKLYRNYVIKKKFTYPLQLILLSHDDLVVNSFSRGFSSSEYLNLGQEEKLYFPFDVGRIYRLDELDALGELEKQSGLNNQLKRIYRYV